MSTRKTLILMLMKMCVRVFDRLVLDVPSSNTHTFHVRDSGLISCVFESCVCVSV